MYLEIIERPRTWILWISRLGLALSSLLLLNQLLISMGLQGGTIDQALIVMIGMLFISCLLGSLFKRVSIVDRQHKELSTLYSLLLQFCKKVYSFEKLSSVYVRTELAETQGADIERQANTSFKTPLFIVMVDLKGFGKGRKRIRLKKCFDRQEADELAAQVAALIN